MIGITGTIYLGCAIAGAITMSLYQCARALNRIADAAERLAWGERGRP